MKRDITAALVHEHKLILRMLAVLERNALATAAGTYSNYRFYLDGVDFIRNYADRYHHAKEEDVLFEALVKNGMPRENSPVAAMLMEHEQGRVYVRDMAAAAQALAVLPDMTIGCLYERGEKNPYEKITFARLSIEWLTQSADSLYPAGVRPKSASR